MGVFVVKCLSRIPLWLSYRTLAPLLYVLIFYVFRYRVKVASDNIARAFPEQTEKDNKQLLKRYYHYLAEMFCEVLHSPRLSVDELKKRMHFKNPEVVNDLHAQGKPVILVALHQCNWEWLLNSGCVTLDPQVEVIYKPLHNKAFDEYFKESRSKFNPILIPHKRAIADFAHRRDAFFLALLADQAPLKKRQKAWTKMFDRDTAFPLGVDFFAKKSDAVVVFANPVRVSRGHYEVEIEVISEPPYDDSFFIIEQYAKRGEAAIRNQPETWLWSNRRWSYSKADDPTLSEDSK